MAVIRRDSGFGWEVVVWDIAGECEVPADCVTEADRESASGMTSVKRRTEHLAARAALREILPDAVVAYDGYGAPLIVSAGRAGEHYAGIEWLTAEKLYVSFSHCAGAAAAIVSRKPCAIDIEMTTRDFGRAADRFVSDRERTLSGMCDNGSLPGKEGNNFLAAAWCTKEALYKYGRLPGTDFLRDMEILSYDPHAGKITARLRDIDGIEVAVKHFGDYIYCHIPA